MENWVKINLEEVCLIKKGEQLNKLDLESAGDYPCINGGISPSGYTEKWNTKANTITISEGGNSCGFVNMLRTDFWSGGHCYSLLDVKDKIDNEFLYYALKGRESLIMDLRVGSGLPNIQQKAIKKFEFIYPKDKTEQQAIANILSKTDQAIAHTEALIAKYTKIKTGLMQDLLTKGIDENGNIRTEQSHEFKDSPLGRIPKEWQFDFLGKITKVIDPNPSHRNPVYFIDGFPFISTTDFTKDGGIDLSFVRRVAEITVLEQESRCDFSYDSLIISRKGTIGEVRYTPYPIRFALLDSVCVINTKSSITSKWLYHFLNSSIAKTQLDLMTRGVALQQVSLGRIRELIIAIPDKNEQERIVNHLKVKDKIIEIERVKLNKLQSLKTGLMQDLLSGKVRVNNLINKDANGKL